MLCSDVSYLIRTLLVLHRLLTLERGITVLDSKNIVSICGMQQMTLILEVPLIQIYDTLRILLCYLF